LDKANTIADSLGNQFTSRDLRDENPKLRLQATVQAQQDAADYDTLILLEILKGLWN
jgi:hypothetical protein